MQVRIVESPQQRRNICLAILRALPDWFGSEVALLDYAHQCETLPVFAALEGKQPLGFVALKQHSKFTREICVMGALPEAHRRGVGRALLSACEETCRAEGTRFLTVKTLADTHPDEGYAKTRAFYQAMGFVPLEVFPLHWDEENPCLFMAKYLD